VEIKVKMVKNAEKNHSVRYDAVDQGAAMNAVYIRKEFLRQEGVKGYPDEITVTIN
jgi:hypothetical protein